MALAGMVVLQFSGLVAFPNAYPVQALSVGFVTNVLTPVNTFVSVNIAVLRIKLLLNPLRIVPVIAPTPFALMLELL